MGSRATWISFFHPLNLPDMTPIQQDISPRVQIYEDDAAIVVRVWVCASRNGRWTDYMIHGQQIPAGAVMYLSEEELAEVRRLTNNRKTRSHARRK
jgi:hypothetical protein